MVLKHLLTSLRKFEIGHGITWDFILNLGSNFLLTAIGIFTGSLLARLLGPEGRGQLAAIQMFAMLLVTLGTLGVENALIYYTGRRKSEVGDLIVSAWTILLPGSLFWMGLGYVLLPALLKEQGPEIVEHARLFLLILPLAYLNRAVWALQSLKRFDLWIVHNWHKPLLYVVVLLLLWRTGAASPYNVSIWFLIISTVGPVLTLALIRQARIRLAPPSLRQMRDLLHYGIRSVLGSLPQELNLRLDQFFIVLWLSEAELGLYVVAVSWSLAINPLVNAVNTVAFPYVAAAADMERRQGLFAASVRTSFISILVANVLLVLVTPIAIPLLFGQSFRATVPISIVLIVASSFHALKMVLSSGLRGLGYPEATAYAEIFSLVCTLSLLILLLPQLGIMGAAVASLSAYLLAAIILVWFAHRKTSIPVKHILVITSSDLQQIRRRTWYTLCKLNALAREHLVSRRAT